MHVVKEAEVWHIRHLFGQSHLWTWSCAAVAFLCDFGAVYKC